MCSWSRQRREVRTEVRDALRNMGLIVDFVSSVDEAVAFCAEGLPHAIVIEALLCADRFERLRNEIAAEVPQFVFIQIIEDSCAFRDVRLHAGEHGACRPRRDRAVVAPGTAVRAVARRLSWKRALDGGHKIAVLLRPRDEDPPGWRGHPGPGLGVGAYSALVSAGGA